MDRLKVTGIYKLLNTTNGKMYIGQSRDIANRMRLHVKDSKRENDKRGQFPIYDAMRKYGHENFKIEVIEVCNEDELDAKEMHYIDLFDSTNPEKGYNLTKFANGFEDPRIIRDSHTPEIMAMHGERIKKWNEEQWKKKEYRKAMSKQSSRVQLERLKCPKYYEEKSKHLKQATDKMKTKVGQFDDDGNLIATYEGTRVAERAMGLANDSIGKVCRGVKFRKKAGGYVWKYL